MRRALAVAFVLGLGTVTAFAIGDGSVVATPGVAVVPVAGSGGSGSALFTNTTTDTIGVQLAADVSCEPDVSFEAAGSDAFSLAPGSNQVVGLACDAQQPFGIERCLVHATDATTGAALADVLAVCEDAPGTDLAAPASLAFGDVTIGAPVAQTIAIANTGSAAFAQLFLQTDDLDADYTFAAPCNPDAPFCTAVLGGVPPGGSASVVVTCAPRSAGAHPAQLLIATETGEHTSVALTCNGITATGPVLGISPATINVVAPVEAGSGSAQAIVRLANVGTAMAYVTDARLVDVVRGAATDWAYTIAGTCTVLPCTLAPGAEVDLVVAFRPTVIARRDASLLVSYHENADETHSIPLFGVGQGATLAGLGPAQLDFGEVPIGRTSSLPIQLVNRGNRDTTPALTVAPTGAIATTGSDITVSPTAIAAATATCTPIVAGSATATITAQTTDTLAGDAVTIAATCNGITTPLYADPSGVPLGELQVGGAPQTITLALDSTGSALAFSGTPALDVDDPDISIGALSSATTPATLTVTVTPTTAHAITRELVVMDTAGDTLRVPIAGSVAAPAIAATPTLDIGTFCVGQPTSTATVALANTGSAVLAVGAPALAVGSAFQIAFDAPTLYPASLAPATTATVAVTPLRQTAPAMLSDTVAWSTGDAAEPAATTTITAEFIGSGGAISPPALDFGQVPVHVFEDNGQRVVLQNCNDSAVDLDHPTISPPFYIDSPAFPSTLAPNETLAFSIGFHPTSLGLFSQVFSVKSPQAGTLSVLLAGDSVSTTAPPPDAGTGSSAPTQTSFYACSAGGRGGWPIALAVVFAIRRRRRGSSSPR